MATSLAEFERCQPVFTNTFGCSVCIKVCPFTSVGYDKLHTAWQRKQARRSEQ